MKNELRKFGIVVGGVAVAVASILFFVFEREVVSVVLAALGGMLLALGLVYPRALAPVERVWMKFAYVLGQIMTTFILALLFFLVITPMGLIARLFGKKFLDLSWKSGKESYWHEREEAGFSKESFERQF